MIRKKILIIYLAKYTLPKPQNLKLTTYPAHSLKCLGEGCLSIIHIIITLRRKPHIKVKQPLRGKRLVLWNLPVHVISSLHRKARFPLTSTSPTHSSCNTGTSEVPPRFLPHAPFLSVHTCDFCCTPGIPVASRVPPDCILNSRVPPQLSFILHTISASTARKLHPYPTPASCYLTGKKRASPPLSAHIPISSTTNIS